jgi:hypothetical protein
LILLCAIASESIAQTSNRKRAQLSRIIDKVIKIFYLI